MLKSTYEEKKLGSYICPIGQTSKLHLNIKKSTIADTILEWRDFLKRFNPKTPFIHTYTIDT